MHHRELQTIAALCASVALIVVGAVLISNSHTVGVPSPATDTQTAALCDYLPGGCGTITHFQSPPIHLWACDKYTDSSHPQCAEGSGNHLEVGHDTGYIWYQTGFATTPGQVGNCWISGGEFGTMSRASAVVLAEKDKGTGTLVPNGYPGPNVITMHPNGQNVTYTLYCYESYETGWSDNTSSFTVSYCPANYKVDGNGQCISPGSPLLSITANPGTVYSGGYTTIDWSADNVDSCVVNNNTGQIGTGTSGSQNRGPFSSGDTFTLLCQSSAGPKSDSVTVSYGNCAGPQGRGNGCTIHAPTLSLTANPTSVPANTKSTLSYSASGGTNLDACLLAGGKYGAGTPVNTSGTAQTENLTSDTQYSYTCHDASYGWQPWQNVTVSVGAPSSLPPPPVPTITDSCPAGLVKGNSCTISWVCPAQSTGSFGSFPTGGRTTGTYDTSPPSDTNYTVSCNFPDTMYQPSVSTAGITIHVSQPTLSIIATPSRVRSGDKTTISWSAANVTPNSCSVTKTGGGPVGSGLTGSINPTITQATEYTLSCSTPVGAVSQSVTVTPLPSEVEI